MSTETGPTTPGKLSTDQFKAAIDMLPLVSIDLLKTFQTFVIVNYNFFFGFISLSYLYFQFGILHIEARSLSLLGYVSWSFNASKCLIYFCFE